MSRVFMAAEIALTSGGHFCFEHPERSRFTLLDVVSALARMPRFAGQGLHAYSTAEHSVHASYLVPRRYALAALLHDAHEAFVGDMTAPLKALCPDYKRIERLAAAHVIPHLGGIWPLPAEVKSADLQMLAAEKRQVMASDAEWPALYGVPEPDVRVRFWDERRAKREFLDRYDDLIAAA